MSLRRANCDESRRLRVGQVVNLRADWQSASTRVYQFTGPATRCSRGCPRQGACPNEGGQIGILPHKAGRVSLYLMAGGGTGGHVIPAIAVAREMVREGHEVLFVGTERGVEARLVPACGVSPRKDSRGRPEKSRSWRRGSSACGGWSPKRWDRWGGSENGARGCLQHGRLRSRTAGAGGSDAWRPCGGHGAQRGAGRNQPWIARWVKRALISFEETARFFPKGERK